METVVHGMDRLASRQGWLALAVALAGVLIALAQVVVGLTPESYAARLLRLPGSPITIDQATPPPTN